MQILQTAFPELGNLYTFEIEVTAAHVSSGKIPFLESRDFFDNAFIRAIAVWSASTVTNSSEGRTPITEAAMKDGFLNLSIAGKGNMFPVDNYPLWPLDPIASGLLRVQTFGKTFPQIAWPQSSFNWQDTTELTAGECILYSFWFDWPGQGENK